MDIPEHDDEQPALAAGDLQDPAEEAEEVDVPEPVASGEDEAAVEEGWERARSMTGEAPTG